jgi:putative colanic acid biosynthesis UDP-glucose lipid carrier transferase
MKQPRGILKRNADALLLVSQVVNPLLVGLVGYLTFYFYLLPKPEFDDFPARYQIAILVGMLLTILILSWFQVYRPWRGIRLRQELWTIFLAWGGAIMVMIIIAFFTKTSTDFSRVWIVGWWITSGILIIALRVAIRLSLRFARSRGYNQRQVVVAGAGSLGQKIVSRIRSAPWVGLEIIGFFDDNEQLQGQVINGIPVAGKLDDMEMYLQKEDIDQVWIALPLRAETRMKQLMKKILVSTSAEIRFVPDIFEFRLLNFSVSEVVGLPVLNLTDSPMFGIHQLLKAVEDRIIAGLALIILAPIMALIALGVKLSSPGPAFYRQERVSWNGLSFTMLKFRSMPVNAEQSKGAQWATAGDQRTTLFGHFLRRTSLDELPQLVNVIKGEMSIVGPRPERPVFIEEFRTEIPDYMQKHLVKAGITGWAQVNGWRGDTDLGTRIKYDLYYIENWSISLDLKIMIMTVFKGMIHKNAY